MTFRPIYIVPVLVFMGLSIGLYIGLSLDPKETAFPLAGKPPPAFDLDPLHEGQPRLTEADLLSGKITFVNFFASWCAPCKLEHPYLMQLAERDDVVVIGIDYKDTPEDARAWLSQDGNPYSLIGRDDTGRVGIDWGLAGVPETFVIDRDGNVAYRFQGPILQAEYTRQVLPMLEYLTQ